VVFIHPADLPGPEVAGVVPFAADFLLDTTRAAYLLVPVAVSKLFAAGLETFDGLDAAGRSAIDRRNALALFPRLGAAPQPPAPSPLEQIRHTVSRAVLRGVVRKMGVG